MQNCFEPVNGEARLMTVNFAPLSERLGTTHYG
jgi:hypothetical protein